MWRLGEIIQQADMEIEHFFVAYEVDLNYEFDAARFFDFRRDETPGEASQAELWFQTAISYPPSPFVTELVATEDSLFEINISPKPTCLEHTSNMDDNDSNFSSEMEFPESAIDNQSLKAVGGKISGLQGGILHNSAKQPQQVTTGLTFCSMTISDSLNSEAKSVVPKSSTLMKPTTSQLAKQKSPPQIVGSRFRKLLAQNKEGSLSSWIENQATKRQKLEGGLLHMVADVRQQINLVHKAPKKAVIVGQNATHAKLKHTILREPDLETAHRAQRMRPKLEEKNMPAPRFRARPLNRKILDAPSLPLHKRSTPRLPEFQEFHLKTMERAMQHRYASSSSSLYFNDSDEGSDKHSTNCATENRIRDLNRPSINVAPKDDGLKVAHNFKGRSLNEKILSSKGDIGIFQNSKQETTVAVPMDFDFHTEKRVQLTPPIEMFSKLSLNSELQPNIGSQLKLPQHSTMFRKESKENIFTPFHPEQKELGRSVTLTIKDGNVL